MMSDIEPRTRDYEAAHKYLGISRRHLERLVADGEIRVTRSGRRVLFLPEELDAYLERQSRGGAPRED